MSPEPKFGNFFIQGTAESGQECERSETVAKQDLAQSEFSCTRENEKKKKKRKKIKKKNERYNVLVRTRKEILIRFFF